jgi:tripartite-type tricarboxylate transporter receptor subunit TctC
MVVVNSGLPAKSVQELIALAKAQPGHIAAASSIVGTTNHLTLEMFKAMSRIELLHVPWLSHSGRRCCDMFEKNISPQHALHLV